MSTEELLTVGPNFVDTASLRRVRFLIAGNKMLKDSMTTTNAPAVNVLSNLIHFLYEETDKLQDFTMESQISISELTELILVLHSLVITHPAVILEHEPRRFVNSIIRLMQTRNYEMTLSCLRLFKALTAHCLPDAQPLMRQVAQDVLTATADLFYDPKLVKMFIMSMSKNRLVKDLIQAIFAGLTCSSTKTAAAMASVGQLDSYCNIKSLSESDTSEQACFHTLVSFYNLLILTPDDMHAAGCAANVQELRARLIDSPENVEALTQLHNALYSPRVRSLAVAILLRLYISHPDRLDEQRLTFVPRLLHGFVRLVEIMSRNGIESVSELARLAFRDMAICIHSASSNIVSIAVHCNHLCTLLDSISPPDEEWRLLIHALLMAFALRLDAARLQVATLNSPQRLLKDFSSDHSLRRLHSDMLFILALSRSVEVLRSLLVDHPGLVDTLLTVIQRSRSSADVDTLSLAVKLLANLSLPVAGALHVRIVERQVARLMADIAKARVELPLRVRLYALATLTNLSLTPDSTDVAASLGDGVEQRATNANVTLKGPLNTSALVDLLEEANDLTSVQDRQQLGACVAQLARNLARNSVDDTFEDDDDEEEEDEEEKENSQEQLQRLLLFIINSPLTSFGADAKEAALMAITSLAASRRMSLMLLLSADWANQLVSNFIREPYSSNCQTAAMLAISQLDALELPWRRRVRQEVESSDVENAIKSEGALFLRRKFLQESREMEMTAMSGSESS